METKYFIKNEKYDIPTVLHMPDANEKVPAVILCHGTSAEKDEAWGLFVYLAKALAGFGIASIRLDFAGCGESKADPMDLTFLGEVDDVEKVYAFLREQETIDKSRIGILGLSQGARVMAAFLGNHPDDIKAAVSWSGSCHNGEGCFAHWFRDYYDLAEKQGYARIAWGWQDNLILTKEWFDELRATKPMDSLASYNGDLLAVGGTVDKIVPCEHAGEIAEVCKNGELLIIENADHILNVKGKDETVSQGAVKKTAEWFAAHLK